MSSFEVMEQGVDVYSVIGWAGTVALIGMVGRVCWVAREERKSQEEFDLHPHEVAMREWQERENVKRDIRNDLAMKNMSGHFTKGANG